MASQLRQVAGCGELCGCAAVTAGPAMAPVDSTLRLLDSGAPVDEAEVCIDSSRGLLALLDAMPNSCRAGDAPMATGERS